MHISQIRESKYLKKEDCGKGILVTIDRIEPQNVAASGQPEELKFCLFFQEDVNPMVLNTTNAQLIAGITGSEETDAWHGHQIVCYNDPTISFAGKITGGIRVRAPRVVARANSIPARPAPAPAPARPAPAPAPARPTPAPARPAPVPAELPVDPNEEDDVPF